MAISRRRFIRISGAAAGLGLLPNWANSSAAAAELVSWHGVALGAAASMQLHHPDPVAARNLIARVVSEVDRLESIFSLYRSDSALSELNRRGVIVAPPRELVEVLAECDRYWHLTGGVFDPTVQPLWTCYAAHFSQGTTGLPPASKVEDALRRVGWRHVRFDVDVVAFARKGMAITLNGIAQGYITDVIVKLLTDAGISNALVDMGEIRATGGKPDARPWSVELDLPHSETPSKRVIALSDRAVATSSADGFVFDRDGGYNHLLDPVTGRCANAARSVSVVADTATCADALSTAFELVDSERIRLILERVNGAEAYVSDSGAINYLSGV